MPSVKRQCELQRETFKSVTVSTNWVTQTLLAFSFLGDGWLQTSIIQAAANILLIAA